MGNQDRASWGEEAIDSAAQSIETGNGRIQLSDEIDGRIIPDAIHNAAVRRGNEWGFGAAYEIIKEGLRLFPADTDLLADAVLYANSMEAYNYFGDLMNIERRFFTWRAFDFSIDYIVDFLVNVNFSNLTVDVLYEKANVLADDFIKWFPQDERAYEAKVKVLEKRNAEDDRLLAERIYHDLVLENRYNSKEVGSFPKPQLCMGYADILLARGEYELAADVATIGLAGSAQDQPSVSLGYLNYVRALARDAQLQLDSRSDESVFDDLPRIVRIMKDYEIAKKQLQNSTYVKNANYRQQMLAIMANMPVSEDAAEQASAD